MLSTAIATSTKTNLSKAACTLTLLPESPQASGKRLFKASKAITAITIKNLDLQGSMSYANANPMLYV